MYVCVCVCVFVFVVVWNIFKMLVVKAQQIKILILIFFKLRKETRKRGGELGVVGLWGCGGSYYGVPNFT